MNFAMAAFLSGAFIISFEAAEYSLALSGAGLGDFPNPLIRPLEVIPAKLPASVQKRPKNRLLGEDSGFPPAGHRPKVASKHRSNLCFRFSASSSGGFNEEVLVLHGNPGHDRGEELAECVNDSIAFGGGGILQVNVIAEVLLQHAGISALFIPGTTLVRAPGACGIGLIRCSIQPAQPFDRVEISVEVGIA